MMPRTRPPKYLWIIMGVLMGVASAVVGQVPRAIAVWSGLRLLAGYGGWVIGPLVVAYFYSEKWLIGYAASAMTIIFGTIVDYAIIAVFEFWNIFPTEGYANILKGLVFWCGVGVVCGGLAAIAMWLVLRGKRLWLRFCALIATYLGVLAVICYYYVRIVARSYAESIATASRYIADGRFAGDVFETVLAFAIATALFTFALKKGVSPKTEEYYG